MIGRFILIAVSLRFPPALCAEIAIIGGALLTILKTKWRSIYISFDIRRCNKCYWPWYD